MRFRHGLVLLILMTALSSAAEFQADSGVFALDTRLANIDQNENGVPDGYEDALFPVPIPLDDLVRGDADLNGVVNLTDAQYVLEIIDRPPSNPDSLQTADANCEGEIASDDALAIIQYLNSGGMITEVPAEFRVESGANQVTAFWRPVIHANLAGYAVYRSSDGGASYEKLGRTPDASFTDTHINTQEYWYYVVTVDVFGNEGPRTAPIKVMGNTIRVWIPQVWGAPEGELGSDIRVPINFGNARGIVPQSMSFVVKYDPAMLEYTNVTKSILSQDVRFDDEDHEGEGSLTVVGVRQQISGGGEEGEEGEASEVGGEGRFFDLHFKVRHDAAAGEGEACSALTLTEALVRDRNDDRVRTTLEPGRFCVDTENRWGDLDRNGLVDTADAMLCLQIAVQQIPPSPYQQYVGDLNGDGRIDSADAVMILRMAANIPIQPIEKAAADAGFDAGTRSVSIVGKDVGKGRHFTVPVVLSDASNVAGVDLIYTWPAGELAFDGAEVDSALQGAEFEINPNPGMGSVQISLGAKTSFASKGPIALVILGFTATGNISDARDNPPPVVRLNHAELKGPYGQSFLWYGGGIDRGEAVFPIVEPTNEGEGEGEGMGKIINGALVVRVADADTRASITNASLMLVSSGLSPVTKNVEGVYVFPAVPEGVYPLLVSAPDYDEGNATVTIVGGETLTVPVLLKQAVEGEAPPAKDKFLNCGAAAGADAGGREDVITLILAGLSLAFCARRQKMRRLAALPILLVSAVSGPVWAAQTVDVSNVRVRVNNGAVHVTYDLSTSDNEPVPVRVLFSTDGGASYPREATTLEGSAGPSIKPGMGKYILWKAYNDFPEQDYTQARIRIRAVDSAPPVITLLGDNPATVEVGATYTDAGATAMDNADGDITSEITVGGLPLNTSAVGVHTMTYNVTDASGNQAVQVTRTVNVVQATPVVVESPSGTITYGQTLADAALSSGQVSSPWAGSILPGTWSFDSPTMKPTVADSGTAYPATFTPDDTMNYKTVHRNIEVTVNKADPAVIWPAASLTYGQTLAEALQTGGSAANPYPPNTNVSGAFTFTAPTTAPPVAESGTTFEAQFTAEDTANYNVVAGSIVVTVNKATPVVTWPAATVYENQTLAEAEFAGGSGTPAGAFTFDDPTHMAALPDNGLSFAATFTPGDTENYNTVHEEITLTVYGGVVITPPSAQIVELETITLTAKSNPTILGDASFDWAEDSGVISLRDFVTAGLVYNQVEVTALRFENEQSASTSIQVIGSPSGSTALVPITVIPNVVSVEPLSASIEVGQTLSLTATTLSNHDSFIWATSDAGIALAEAGALYNEGTVTGVAAGGPIEINVAGTATNRSATAAITVVKATPQVTWPSSAWTIAFGHRLEDSALSLDGSAVNPWTGVSIAGTFAFEEPGLTPAEGNYAATVVYTPADSANYNSASGTVIVPVSGGVVISPPSATLFEGDQIQLFSCSGSTGDTTFTWDEVVLTQSVVSVQKVDETYAWVTAGHLVADTDIGTQIRLTGNQSLLPILADIFVKRSAVTVAPTTGSIEVGQTMELTASSLTQRDGFLWASGPGSSAAVVSSGLYTALVTGQHAGSENITATGTASGRLSAPVSVTVSKATPNLTFPSSATVYLGRTLASAVWDANGSAVNPHSGASVPGSFGFANPSFQALETGSFDAEVHFVDIPDDYNDLAPGLVPVNVVEGVSVTPSSASIYEGDQIRLTPSSIAGDTGFTWAIEDSSVVSLETEGELEFWITALHQYSDANAATKVQVTGASSSLVVSADIEVLVNTVAVSPAGSLTIEVGQTAVLTATTNAIRDTFAWQTAGTLASVIAGSLYNEGIVTGVHAGGPVDVTATGTASQRSSTVALTVAKATPLAGTWPTGTLVYGHPLSEAVLTGGMATNPHTGDPVPGSWEFVSPADAPSVSQSGAFGATFVPTDPNDYNLVTGGTITVTVSKADPEVTWPTATLTYGQRLADALQDGGVGDGLFTFLAPETTPAVSLSGPFDAAFTPTDTENYSTLAGSIMVTVDKAIPVATWPAAAMFMSQTLAEATLTGGSAINPYTSADVPGTFPFDTPTLVLSAAGAQDQPATFTPTETANYSTIAGVVSVTVSNPVSIAPLLATLYEGDTVDLTATSFLAADTSFTWAPIDSTVVSLTGAGNLFTVRALNQGSGGDTAAQVSVTGGTSLGSATSDIVVLVNTVTVDPAVATIEVGQETSLTAATNSVNDLFDLSTTDAAVATVTAGVSSGAATVTGVGVGEAIVTMTGSASQRFGVSNITVVKATPDVIWPTASIIEDQALADAVFTGESVVNPHSGASVPGVFTFTDPTITPGLADNGTAYSAIFTPEDTANYNAAAGMVIATVDTVVTQTFTLPGGVPLEMVWIQAGTFMMGSPRGEVGRDSFEDPQHQVTLSRGFWMGKYELTQEQWMAVMSDADPLYVNPSNFLGNHLPVERVSWNEITEKFLPALNSTSELTFRLPTEAEWEYACRAETGSRFYWGDDLGYTEIGDHAWYAGNSGSQTHDIGTAGAVGRPNNFGLYDMNGNVWEWVQDWLGYYASGSVTDPTGPATGSFRVTRGGAWDGLNYYCRSAARDGVRPSKARYNIGLRLAVGDTTPPIITLEGEAEVTILAGSTYTDAGATAWDNIDGNITDRIVTTGLPVDTSISRDCTVTYDVMDAAGNAAAQVTRTVHVSGMQTVTLPGAVPLALDMVWIPAGTFMMGSPDSEQDRGLDEGPQHEVTLSQGFWIGIYELTQAQWMAVMTIADPSYVNPSAFQGNNLPVETVSWNEITQTFLPALNAHTGLTFRLPTEAEWEYACRANTATRFYWGDDLNYNDIANYAWYLDNSSSGTQDVGGKTANAFGLYDLSGNVWEWVQDWYGPYEGGPVVDPTGPATGSSCVVRGGSWDGHDCLDGRNLLSSYRSAYRCFNLHPGRADYIVGFRVAM